MSAMSSSQSARIALSYLLLALSAAGIVAQPAASVRLVKLEIAARSVRGPDVAPGRPVGSVRLTQGETVELHWTSDEPVTLHLHGYNIETRVAATSTAIMRVRARATGRFAIETHGIGRDKHLARTLLYVEVHPR